MRKSSPSSGSQSSYKAIFVDGNAVHKAAMKPENKESDIKTPVEFPF